MEPTKYVYDSTDGTFKEHMLNSDTGEYWPVHDVREEMAPITAQNRDFAGDRAFEAKREQVAAPGFYIEREPEPDEYPDQGVVPGVDPDTPDKPAG